MGQLFVPEVCRKRATLAGSLAILPPAGSLVLGREMERGLSGSGRETVVVGMESLAAADLVAGLPESEVSRNFDSDQER